MPRLFLFNLMDPIASLQDDIIRRSRMTELG